MYDIAPHLTFISGLILSKRCDECVERGSITTFETEYIPFMKKLATGFDEIFKNRKTVVTIDATLPLQNVVHYALQTIIHRMEL
jgi:thymidylate kinase